MTLKLPTSDKPLAFSYIRMSTTVQLRGDSLRRQKELSTAYADKNGLHLVTDFKLEDIGLSAFDGSNVKKGALSVFLKAVENHQIPRGSFLLVESFDRLSREKVEAALANLLALNAAGINVVTLSDEQVYMSGELDMQRLIYSIVVMSRANEESEIKSKRLRSAWSNKRRTAKEFKITKIAPAWLTLSEGKVDFLLNDEKADVVREIYNLALMGLGAYSITRQLNDRGVETFGKSKDWGQSYVAKILTNRAVIGEFQPHTKISGERVPEGAPIENYFPQIIDKELFLSVQAARKKRSQSGSGRKGKMISNLFTNIAICHFCGSPMHYINKGLGSKGGVYLKCSKAIKSNECHPRLWKYNEFETSFLYFCQEINLQEVVTASSVQTVRDGLQNELKLIDQELDGLLLERKKVFDFIKRSDVNQTFYEEQMHSIGQKIEDIKESKSSISSKLQKSDFNVNLDKEKYAGYIAEIQSDLNASYTQRVSLRELIRKLVLTLQLGSIGPEPATSKIKQLLLVNASSSEEYSRIEKYFEKLKKSKNTIDVKYFFVELANNVFKLVVVNSNDPYVFDIKTELDLEINITEGGLVA